jgi:hypothetical protein
MKTRLIGLIVATATASTGLAASAVGSPRGSAVSLGSHQTRLVAHGGRASDFFGAAGGVAISKDTIVVGEPGHHGFRGGAVVYRRSGPTSSHAKQVAVLVASDGVPLDHLGRGVAVAGNTIAVSAPDRKTGGDAGRGAVYVFVKPKHGWSGVIHESAILTSSDGLADDSLGFDSVAASGHTIIAASENHQVGANTHQGAVYVFVKPKHGWTGHRHQTAELVATDGGAYDQLGAEGIGIEGRTVVAGAGGHQVGTHTQQGAVYLFAQPAAGWSGVRHETSQLTRAHGATGDGLGVTGVAISGSTIVAGTPDAEVQGKGDAGVVYVFVRPKSGWRAHGHEAARLIASDPHANDGLAHGVAVSGKTVIGVAPGKAVKGHSDQGALYTFTRPKHGWAGTRHENAELVARDGRKGDSLGSQSIATWHTTIVAGASLHRIGTHTYQGAAYVFVP